MTEQAGQTGTAQRHNDDVRKLHRRAGRSTNTSTTTTTEIGVLRIDDAPLKAGRGYLIIANNLMLTSSVNNDGIVSRFRSTSDGSAPGVASTQRSELRMQTLDAQGQAGAPMCFTYYPAADEDFSVLLTVIRISGTGNVFIAVLGGVIQFEIIDLGPDTGNVGVPL